MSRWTSDTKQRASKKYQILHAKLAREVQKPIPDKIARHRREAQEYRQRGET